jgi:zinc transport system substrate-binding protein
VEDVATAEGRSHLSVYVVNYPLQYFAERIGGAHVEVSFPAPREVDPAYWSPDAETIAGYQSADLILLNGAGYAQWVELASLPQARLVDTSAAFQDRYIPMEEGTVHTHGPEGEHSHKGYAFTTWLDPTLAIEQARAIAASFSETRTGDAGAFQTALDGLESDLLQLDERLTAVAESLGNQPLLFSHAVYQYLARRYDLNGRSVHWEPDQEPAEETWRELDELLATHPARWMIWEDEPLETTARRLEERGIASLVYRPSPNLPQEGDLLTVLQADLASLEAATR